MSSHARRKKIELLWREISEALEDSLPENVLTATAANQQKNQVRFRLQRAIAKLTYAKSISLEDTKDIRADILLSETIGWLNADAAKAALDRLDDIEGEF